MKHNLKTKISGSWPNLRPSFNHTLSAQNTPHSACKDIATDFTEGSICRTGQVRLQ
jgi:hypothetical protein